MDKLALLYENQSIITDNAVRSELVSEVIRYNRLGHLEKRNALLDYATAAEVQFLIEQGILTEWGSNTAEVTGRGMLGAVGDKIKGAFGGQESNARNKIIEVYKKVWAEYRQYMKSIQSNLKTANSRQRGFGGNPQTPRNDHYQGQQTPESVFNFLVAMNFDPKEINETSKALNIPQDERKITLNNEEVGKIIYKALQIRYQAAAAADQPQQQYQPQYQLPSSL